MNAQSNCQCDEKRDDRVCSEGCACGENCQCGEACACAARRANPQ